jgi:hypothetical protein
MPPSSPADGWLAARRGASPVGATSGLSRFIRNVPQQPVLIAAEPHRALGIHEAVRTLEGGLLAERLARVLPFAVPLDRLGVDASVLGRSCDQRIQLPDALPQLLRRDRDTYRGLRVDRDIALGKASGPRAVSEVAPRLRPGHHRREAMLLDPLGLRAADLIRVDLIAGVQKESGPFGQQLLLREVIGAEHRQHIRPGSRAVGGVSPGYFRHDPCANRSRS